MDVEKVSLSQATIFELRGNVSLRVYSASLEMYTLVMPRIKSMESKDAQTDIGEQVKLFVDIIYDLVKEDNDITKDILLKVLTLEACIKIMQKALGGFGNIGA